MNPAPTTPATVLIAVALIGGVLAVLYVVKLAVDAEMRQVDREQSPQRHRPSDPQTGQSVATGTGVERGPLRAMTDADLAVLPRSPKTPAAAADPRPVAVAGLHRRPVIIHDR